MRAIQIFVRNHRMWASRPLSPAQVEAFRAAWRASEVRSAVAHGTYLVNLASESDEIRARSVRCLREELSRVARLGLRGLVLHPGSAGAGPGARERGIARILAGIEKALGDPAAAGARLILENTAGAGGTIGTTFAELGAIIAALPSAIAARVDVCVDTCHLHSAGYDLTTPRGYEATMRELEETVGLERLATIHLNDSLCERGARVDRHANIGEGTIGLSLFEAILHDPRLRDVPKILETPPEDRGRERDLATLAGLRQKKRRPAGRPGKAERSQKGGPRP